MGTFRPSARVRLQLRIDEATNTGPLRSTVRSPSEEVDPSPGLSREADASVANLDRQLDRVNRQLRQLRQARETTPPEQFAEQQRQLLRRRQVIQRRKTRITTQQQNIATQEQPDAITAAAPDELSIPPFDIIPETIEINRNGLRQADTATIRLNFRDFPLDPRILRAVAVDAVIGIVTPQDYQAGVAGALRDDGTPLSLVARPSLGQTLTTSTRFSGVVDDWNIESDADNGDTITIECRDYTSFVIDETLPAGIGIDLSLPIRDGISQLLNRFPSTSGMNVVFGSPGELDRGPGPVPGEALAGAQRARREGATRRIRNGGSRTNLWDHITDTCVTVGLVPCFFGTNLHIIEPRTFYSGQSSVKRMIYGENIYNLQFSRKLQGVKVPTVEVRCYDPAIGRIRWARFPITPGTVGAGIIGVTDPPPPSRANEVTPSGQGSDKIQTFVLDKVTDSAFLSRAARSIYEQIGRQEVEGSFKTMEITSFEGTEGDLLSLNTGDAIELLIQGTPVDLDPGTTTTLQSLQTQSINRRAAYLQELGFSEEVASLLARAQENTNLLTQFNVQDVRVSWSNESGLEIDADFVNFLVVRELDQEAAQAETGENRIGPDPSESVRELTQGNTSQEANRLRQVNSERRRLNDLRSEGSVTNDEYRRQMRLVTAEERRLTRQVRSQ